MPQRAEYQNDTDDTDDTHEKKPTWSALRRAAAPNCFDLRCLTTPSYTLDGRSAGSASMAVRKRSHWAWAAFFIWSAPSAKGVDHVRTF